MGKKVSDFEMKTGLTEEDFYSFMNDVYTKKLDSLDRERIIFAYAGDPIKIEFENDLPTTLEPPGIDFLTAPFPLDGNRLLDFKLIQPKVYEEARAEMKEDNCGTFNSKIGNNMSFIYLPWYNPKDTTLLFKDVDNSCPPSYHQGQGVLYRFKKMNNKWVLIN